GTQARAVPSSDPGLRDRYVATAYEPTVRGWSGDSGSETLEPNARRGALAARQRERVAEGATRAGDIAAAFVSLAELDEGIGDAAPNVVPPFEHVLAVAVDRAVVEVVAAIQRSGFLEAADRGDLVGRLPRLDDEPLELGDILPADDSRVDSIPAVPEHD